MKKTHIGRGLLILLLVSVCVLGFVTSRKADTAKSTKSQFIDPEEMIRGHYYILWDHGAGVYKVQFDRLDKGIIYSTFSIRPSQTLFSRDASCTVYDAGNIQEASATDIAHVQRCVNAGSYTP
jgi:hypothetical protein